MSLYLTDVVLNEIKFELKTTKLHTYRARIRRIIDLVTKHSIENHRFSCDSLSRSLIRRSSRYVREFQFPATKTSFLPVKLSPTKVDELVVLFFLSPRKIDTANDPFSCLLCRRRCRRRALQKTRGVRK